MQFTPTCCTPTSQGGTVSEMKRLAYASKQPTFDSKAPTNTINTTTS
jgi:hypothetical protein